MKFKICYIGSDDKYWSRIRNELSREYKELEIEYLKITTEQRFIPKLSFIKVYNELPQIIYIDFSIEPQRCLELCKLITRNNEMRLVSLVALYEADQFQKYNDQAIGASVRLHHIKSLEVTDVIYDPLSLLDVELAHKLDFVRSKELNKIELSQLLKIGFVDDNFFHVETDSYLKKGDILHLDSHPLEEIMSFKKVYVSKFYDSDIYYNRRFAYDLEFIYIDNDYFSESENNWLLYKDIKKDPSKSKFLPPGEYKKVTEDMDKRKQAFAPTKARIEKWMEQNHDDSVLKKLKIMVIDDSLQFIRQIDNLESFPYTLNIQTHLINGQYQIKRLLPHLIIYHITEKNSFEDLSQMIELIKSIDAYTPYIVLLKCKGDVDKLRSELSFSNILCYKEFMDVEELKKIAESLDHKMNISHSKHRVFIKSSSPNSRMYIKRDAKIIAMTESVLYLQSEVEIPMWTIFKVKSPVKMLLTVVPHRKDVEIKVLPNQYRCLINGVSESQKSQIRQLINKSFMPKDEA